MRADAPAWPPKAAAIRHQRRQALGSCIHRGGETRWAGADDNDVIDLVRVDRFDEPDAAGEFDIARIAQQLSIGTKNDRQFASVDMKAIDQGLRTRIGLWVEPLMRVPVAGKKALEAQNIGMIRAADDHRPAGTPIEKADTAQDQGAHDAFAQLGLFDQQIAQPARRNDECLGGLLGIGIDQGRAARKLCELAHERARTVRYDELGMSRHSAVSDLGPPCQDSESAWRDFAGRGDAIAHRVGFELTEPPQPTDLRRLQRGEYLIASGFDKRMS